MTASAPHLVPTEPPPTCAVTTTVSVIGGKWKAVAVYHLLGGPRRFSDLQRRMPGVTQRILTLQLRELEADGLVHREVYPQVPPKVEYSLTPLGQTLEPIVRAMLAWGETYRQREQDQGD
ncbi:winged helix-turn-helix transcriptional regulator [Deinococcus sp. RM]|uniref:winged helix-turn-helix transcriptional regulator n=1 Tax=Deinococcus sp. RM TaxID=2316359 RepID=UPI000E67DAFA|nr:helix-turn-helix domain-containing protein [Deinococcus sp. RM]RIY04164.1 transcriptional regulator [Deinococcus sp. RM]